MVHICALAHIATWIVISVGSGWVEPSVMSLLDHHSCHLGLGSSDFCERPLNELQFSALHMIQLALRHAISQEDHVLGKAFVLLVEVFEYVSDHHIQIGQVLGTGRLSRDLDRVFGEVGVIAADHCRDR